MDPAKPYTTNIVVKGKHELVADEPTSLGGVDEGPDPYSLLLSALGACTNITTAMYARRKNIKLERIETRLKISKIHRQDCETCVADSEAGQSRNVKIDRIEKVVTFFGDLTDAERKRLFEISERCPVKQTLQRENDIISRYE